MSEYRKARIRLALEPIAQAGATAAMFAGLLAAFVIFA
jgi:hypothetical protein